MFKILAGLVTIIATGMFLAATQYGLDIYAEVVKMILGF